MGSFPEMRYEETEVWTKDAAGNPVSSISDLEHSKAAVHQMPQPRRTDHRTENGGRNRATPQGARTPSVYGNPVFGQVSLGAVNHPDVQAAARLQASMSLRNWAC